MAIFIPAALPTSAASVSALLTSAAKTANGAVLSMAGYTTAGDGGGGFGVIYRRSGKSGITVDNVLYFAGSGADDYFERADRGSIDIRQAGCAGDGSTDDTACFIAAVNVAVALNIPIEVPKGEFRLTTLATPIQIAGNLTITGIGEASKITGPNITTSLFEILPTTASKIGISHVNWSTFRNVVHFQGRGTIGESQELVDLSLENNTCDNFGQGITNPTGGTRIKASSIQINNNKLTNMGLSLEANDSVHCYAIEAAAWVCPKTIINDNTIDTVGSLLLTRHVHGILVDFTGAADKSQSVIVTGNIIKNIASAARAATYQICGIMCLECQPVIANNNIDNVHGMHPQDFTANAGTDVLTTGTVHVLDTDNWVSFIGDDLPDPLQQGTTYYARDCTTYSFKVAASPGGEAIDILDVGSGTMKFSAYHPSSPEAIYTKSTHALIIGNVIKDVLGTEGVINLKGEFTGSASSERTVVQGNNISFRTLPQTAFCTGIACSAPDISVIGNTVEGCARGITDTFNGGIFDGNIIKQTQGVGIEVVPYGANYSYIFKNNTFIGIGTDKVGGVAFGILINTTLDRGYNLLEFTGNTFKDFIGPNQIGIYIVTDSTVAIRKVICNNNVFDQLPTCLIIQTTGVEEINYVEFSFNSIYGATNPYSTNGVVRKTRKLLNTLDGGLWVGNNSPTPFDPTAISGCVSWWQPKDRDTCIFNTGTGEVAVDGYTVARLLDKSGSDNHLNVFNIPNIAPVLHSAKTGGLPYQSLYFRGLGDDMMCTLPASCTTDCTMFMVQKVGARRKFTVNPSTNLFSETSHGLTVTNTAVRFIGDDLPVPLEEGVDYYARPFINHDTFKISASIDGPELDITDSGSGDMFITWKDPIFTWWYQAAGGDYSSPGFAYLWFGQDGDATADGRGFNSGTPTYRKNGVTEVFTTRNEVHDTFGDILSLVTVEGINFSGWDYLTDRMHIGGYPQGTFYINGHFLECILYDRALTTAERSAIEAYLIEEHEVS